MKTGIAPELVVSQVKNTAGWLWTEAASLANPSASAARQALDDVEQATTSCLRGEGTAYLALLLAAHWATVASFVPTDVDSRIRHHTWAAMTDPDAIAAGCEVVDRVAAWDARAVSSRVHEDPKHGLLSGHDGEWLGVRAGALGRAAMLGAGDLARSLAAQIDAEIAREEAIFEGAERSGEAARVLTVATIVAHNLGDLSRVVAEWPTRGAEPAMQTLIVEHQERWLRLGHPDARAKRPTLATAGALNKALVAHENHRFLPLRKPRALRVSRGLLLPIGPWLDGWGETVARCSHLENGDRAEVLAAMLEVHARDPKQEGCLRAISGLHRATRGGIEVLVPDLPARMRKDAVRGRVRDALDVTPAHFAARIERKYQLERKGS